MSTTIEENYAALKTYAQEMAQELALRKKPVTLNINSEEGRVDVELFEGCGQAEHGVSLRVNGICVVHFADYGGILKADVFASAARVAGIRWLDFPQGGFAEDGGIHNGSD